MTWVQWVLFALQLVFSYGPKLVSILRDLVKEIDKRGESEEVPLAGTQKAVIFNAIAKKRWAEVKGAVPTGVQVAKVREWVLQRERGRNWQSPFAKQAGLDKFYSDKAVA